LFSVSITHPRHNHQHATRNVDGEHIIGELALENQLHF
jgi:hypothetical protein